MHGERSLPDADGLIAELDELAGISSIESYYSADLVGLHDVALRINTRPDDRAGRYGALRDTLEQAFDLIEDESYSYAARALLGYSDRWRSVRDRSTDAGRAFTPSVSYDSFRRKGGRNYRENTLRATVDAILGLLHQESEADLAASDASPINLDPIAPELEPEVDRSEAQPGQSRRRAFAIAGLLLAAGIAVALFMRATSENDVSSTTADVTTDVASATNPTPPTPTPEMSPSEPDATAERITPTAVAEPAVDLLQEIDFTRQCRAQLPDIAPVIAERSNTATGGWVCRELATGWEALPDVAEACEDQYGPNTSARFAGGWTCEVATEFLHRPAGSNQRSLCTFPVGSYDIGAVDLNRYSDRFIQAFAVAELPDTVCAGGPMHFYDELPVGGVTQLLYLSGRPYGALLADDPANVILLSEELWRSYEGIRGLQIYQLGLDLLEDRVGCPAGPLRESKGVFRLDLTSGGTLVSSSETGPYVWMPSIALFVWENTGGAQGCLGMPTRSPRTDLDSPTAQEFERATVSIDPDSGQIVFDPPEACDS